MKRTLLIGILLLANVALAETSPGERQQRFREMIAKIDAACASDFQQYCPTAQKHEKGRCLYENKEKLSPGCKALVGNMPAPPPAAH